MPLSVGDLCDRYEALYTGAVVDSMDELGYKQRTLTSEINGLTHDMKTAGIAYPVVGKPDPGADYEENIRRFLDMLDTVPESSVIVYETSDEEAAHLGELSATALQVRGCRGAVIDGGVRDVEYILEQDFPVFSRYRTPADAPPRWRLDDWDVPISINEVEIRPDDIILADVDGVVCIPSDIAETVLDRAEEMVNTENEVREAVKQGITPLDAYEQYGTF
jgi:4-hydroxy-4-methyl-2-oxoglutarate aldolase